MKPNPIEEIKQIRHQLGSEAGFDVHCIFEQLREQQTVSGRTYLSVLKSDIADNKAMRQSGGGQRNLKAESTPIAR